MNSADKKTTQSELALARPSPPAALQRAAATRRIQALFRAMSTDFLLREQFVTDPAQVISEYLYGKPISPHQASAANQLIYAVVSNRPLLAWLRGYALSHRGNPPSRQKVTLDFSHAVVQHDGYHVVLALTRNSVEQAGRIALDDSLIDLIFNGGIFADDDGTGGQEGTGPGTGPSTDSGTDSGTESSPGTDSGTEQSTGTSTEKSGSFFGSQYLLTMEALVNYATGLRRAGALDHAGF